MGNAPEAADDYDIWITVGQSLHSLDESLLDQWILGLINPRNTKMVNALAVGVPSVKKVDVASVSIHVAQEHGWKPSQDYKALGVDDERWNMQHNCC